MLIIEVVGLLSTTIRCHDTRPAVDDHCWITSVIRADRHAPGRATTATARGPAALETTLAIVRRCLVCDRPNGNRHCAFQAFSPCVWPEPWRIVVFHEKVPQETGVFRTGARSGT
jgi:hypothetical protein